MLDTRACLSEAQVARYHEISYVVVKNLIDTQTAQYWKEVLKRRLADEGKLDEPSGVRVWMAGSRKLSILILCTEVYIH